jgi:hypothetical protein
MIVYSTHAQPSLAVASVATVQKTCNSPTFFSLSFSLRIHRRKSNRMKHQRNSYSYAATSIKAFGWNCVGGLYLASLFHERELKELCCAPIYTFRRTHTSSSNKQAVYTQYYITLTVSTILWPRCASITNPPNHYVKQSGKCIAPLISCNYITVA